ncbi:MAG: hypothetical protein KGZ53_02745 [Peptococcaceae bacterium]|nr:hypothetical protein [Peptococcaceae bacterium]
MSGIKFTAKQVAALQNIAAKYNMSVTEWLTNTIDLCIAEEELRDIVGEPLWESQKLTARKEKRGVLEAIR